MTPGKIAAQAGHAYTETLKQDSQHRLEYLSESPGTKICFSGKTEAELHNALQWLQNQGIPCALITDQGHAAFYDGKPTVTALGFGPCRRSEVKQLTKKFRLLP